MFSGPGATADNFPFVNRPDVDEDSPGLSQPPRSTTERHRIADYHRSGAHRDLAPHHHSHSHSHTDENTDTSPRKRLRRLRPRNRPQPPPLGTNTPASPKAQAQKDEIDYTKFSAKVNMVCCVFRPTQHEWRTTPMVFDRLKDNDRDVWWEIRRAYRDRLQGRWRRWLLFKKLAHIVPIEYTHNGVPIRTPPNSYPNRHTFMHAFHHPARTRPDRVWIDWLIAFRDGGDPGKTYGLEFVETLAVEKLAMFSVFMLLVVIITCVLWKVFGGDLQTIFTVMDFVESGIAALLALLALYYQAVLAA